MPILPTNTVTPGLAGGREQGRYVQPLQPAVSGDVMQPPPAMGGGVGGVGNLPALAAGASEGLLNISNALERRDEWRRRDRERREDMAFKGLGETVTSVVNLHDRERERRAGALAAFQGFLAMSPTGQEALGSPEYADAYAQWLATENNLDRATDTSERTLLHAFFDAQGRIIEGEDPAEVYRDFTLSQKEEAGKAWNTALTGNPGTTATRDAQPAEWSTMSATDATLRLMATAVGKMGAIDQVQRQIASARYKTEQIKRENVTFASSMVGQTDLPGMVSAVTTMTKGLPKLLEDFDPSLSGSPNETIATVLRGAGYPYGAARFKEFDDFYSIRRMSKMRDTTGGDPNVGSDILVLSALSSALSSVFNDETVSFTIPGESIGEGQKDVTYTVDSSEFGDLRAAMRKDPKLAEKVKMLNQQVALALELRMLSKSRVELQAKLDMGGWLDHLDATWKSTASLGPLSPDAELAVIHHAVATYPPFAEIADQINGLYGRMHLIEEMDIPPAPTPAEQLRTSGAITTVPQQLEEAEKGFGDFWRTP